jgi:hypothetical protein
MKDQLVTFETSKLAKEKGFEGSCNYWTCIGFSSIKENKKIRPFYCYDDLGNECGSNTVNKIGKSQPHIALVPTQSVLRDWLEEKYDIYIELIIDDWKDDNCISKDLHYRAFIWQCGKPKPHHCDDIGLDNRKSILEKALYEALRRI